MPRRWNAHEQFRYSLARGNVYLAHTAALEVPHGLKLDEALDLIELYAKTGHRAFDRGAARWAARAVLEHRDVDLVELGLIVDELAGAPEGLAERVRAVLHRPEYG